MSALRHLLASRAIAVIGASTHPQKVGHQIFRNLVLQAEETVTKRHLDRRNTHRLGVFSLYPINPSATSILKFPTFPSLSAVKAKVETVIIVTPAPTVPGIVDELIERNRHLPSSARVQNVIVISAGFAETSTKGKNIQHALTTQLRLAGIRLLGPNTLGILEPASHINMSFGQASVSPGSIALISQSGAMLTALFDAMHQRDVGISFAVSLGNKADLNENDALRYAAHDPSTRVIVMYIESFSDIPEFLELASRTHTQKPILLLKGGTSSRGQAASASHTAALATNQVLLAASANQTGFVCVQNMEELVNTAFFLAQHHQIPENVMVLTNAGGPAVTTIDLLAEAQLPLAKWSARSAANIVEAFPQLAVHNPLDLLGDAGPDRVALALQAAQRDPQVESILLIITPQAVTDISGITDIVIANRGRKPIFVALVGGNQLEKARERLRAAQITCTIYPNDLVSMLRLFTQLTKAKYHHAPYVSSAPHQAHWHATAPAPTRRLGQLSLAQASTLLKSHGIKLPTFFLITQHSLEKLADLPYPLFAKTANMSLLHKKVVGAVYGVVRNAAEARQAYRTLAKFGNEVQFQELLEIEQEVLVGYSRDPQFGPYISVGMGGSVTNVLADRQYAFIPTSPKWLRQTWQRTKAAELFAEIFPNRPAVNKSIEEVILAVQKIAMKYPEVSLLEINPLAITSRGVVAADLKLSTGV